MPGDIQTGLRLWLDVCFGMVGAHSLSQCPGPHPPPTKPFSTPFLPPDAGHTADHPPVPPECSRGSAAPPVSAAGPRRAWPAPSRDSRARTRSPSPRAWRPDFPGAARQQGRSGGRGVRRGGSHFMFICVESVRAQGLGTDSDESRRIWRGSWAISFLRKNPARPATPERLAALWLQRDD